MATRKASSPRATKSGAAKAAQKASTGTRARGRRRSEPGAMPRLVYAQASPRSIGGMSLFDAPMVNAENVVAFTSEDQVIRAAVMQLTQAGFQVLQVGATTINIAGPPRLYEQVFGTNLVTEEREVIKEGARADTATFIDTTDTPQRGLIDARNSPLANVIEGVAIEEPIYFMVDAYAPKKSYWHLDVPADVSLGVNADRAHRSGTTGKGVKVVMVDSGWYEHPYFVQRGYRYSPVVLGPGTANPTHDESGHGTAESANLFAVAPDIDFTMVKINFDEQHGSVQRRGGAEPPDHQLQLGEQRVRPTAGGGADGAGLGGRSRRRLRYRGRLRGRQRPCRLPRAAP